MGKNFYPPFFRPFPYVYFETSRIKFTDRRNLQSFIVWLIFENVSIYWKLTCDIKIRIWQKRRRGFQLSGWRVWGFKWRRVNKGAIVYRRQDGIYHAIRARVTEASRVRVTECNSGYSSTSAAKTNLVKLVLCRTETRILWNSFAGKYFYKWRYGWLRARARVCARVRVCACVCWRDEERDNFLIIRNAFIYAQILKLMTRLSQ